MNWKSPVVFSSVHRSPKIRHSMLPHRNQKLLCPSQMWMRCHHRHYLKYHCLSSKKPWINIESVVCTLKIYDHRRIRVDRPIGPICRQKKNCFFHTNWISTSLTSSRAFSATRTFLKQVLRSSVLEWSTVFHNFVILTVEAGDFGSQASGNTFSLSSHSWLRMRGFLRRIRRCKLHWVRYPWKPSSHLSWIYSDCTYGQLGSTVWSLWSAKARPRKDKTTLTLIFNISSFRIHFYFRSSRCFLTRFRTKCWFLRE